MALGIQETKEMVGFLISLGEGIAESLEDGKISLGDLGNFLDAAKAVLPAIGGVNQVGAELLDLTDEEKADLSDYIEEEFDLDNTQVEAILEEGLGIALEILQFVDKYFVKKA